MIVFVISCSLDVVCYSKSARAKFEVRRSSIPHVAVRSVVVRPDVEAGGLMVCSGEEVLPKPEHSVPLWSGRMSRLKGRRFRSRKEELPTKA